MLGTRSGHEQEMPYLPTSYIFPAQPLSARMSMLPQSFTKMTETQLPEAQLPSSQTSIRQGPAGVPIIQSASPLPPLESDMILVRAVAVAVNPTDFKMIDNFPSPGATPGCDFAGIVVAIGPAVNPAREKGHHDLLCIGDRVCGGVHGSNPLRPLVGAFSTYVAAFGDCVLKVPQATNWEQAAALGGAVPGTLGLALVESLGLDIGPRKSADKPVYVLVYGGSTASGTLAIQLLNLQVRSSENTRCDTNDPDRSGYNVITTCSPHNFDLVKSYGAHIAIDYHSPTCAAEIKTYSRNALKYALDTITTAQSLALCYAAIGRAGGKYTGLEMIPPELLDNARRTVKADWVLGVSMSGERIALEGAYGCEARPDRRAFGRTWFALLQGLLDGGQIRSHPPKVMSGGFEGVIDGIDLLRRRGVSGEKLVYFLGGDGGM